MANLAKPPPKRAAWQWAEAHRILPDSSAEPGRYRASRTPWVKDFTEAIANYKYSEVIGVTGAQVGKTDGIGLNTVGWKLMDNPTPTLVFMPTEKSAKSLSRDRMDKMFASVPTLQQAIDPKRDIITEKFINGVRLGFGWGGSATEVASHPAGLVYFDEIDRTKDIPGEGSPWELTLVRGSTYPGFTQVGTSTPTLGKVDDEVYPDTGLIHWAISEHIHSQSWSLWQDGTRHEYMLPCPHCQTHFTPKKKLLWYPDGCTPREVEKQAALRCPHCQVLIEQKHQSKMILAGRMIAPGQYVVDGEVCGAPPDSSTYSGYVNGLCSPWVSWGKRASDLVRALQSGEKGRIQGVINTRFGELVGVSGESPDWQTVRKIRSDYTLGEVPEGVSYLVASVDVQKNRLVYTVTGFRVRKRELEPYLIDYGELFGLTANPEVWELLRTEVLEAEWDGVPLKAMAIDAAYNPSHAPGKTSDKDEKNRNIIYDFCRQYRKAIPMRGSPHPMAMNFTISPIDKNAKGKPLKMGLQLWTVDTDTYKVELYTKIHRALEDNENGHYCTKPGSLHLPENTGDDFLRQLTAEERIVNEHGKIEWIKTFRDNHYLDCMMITLFQADRWRIKRSLERSQTPPLKPKSTTSHKAMPSEVPERSPSPPEVRSQEYFEGQRDDYAGVGEDWEV